MKKSWMALMSAFMAVSPALAQTYVASSSSIPYVPLTNPVGVSLSGSTPPEIDGIAQIPIGFNFPFFGQTFDTLTVTANGNVWLVPPPGATRDFYFSNDVIPDDVLPNALIAPFWDDLSGRPGVVSRRKSSPFSFAS